MKKLLKIIAIAAGIISVVSTIILVCIYMEDVAKYLKIVKEKISKMFSSVRQTEDIYEEE